MLVWESILDDCHRDHTFNKINEWESKAKLKKKQFIVHYQKKWVLIVIICSSSNYRCYILIITMIITTTLIHLKSSSQRICSSGNNRCSNLPLNCLAERFFPIHKIVLFSSLAATNDRLPPSSSYNTKFELFWGTKGKIFYIYFDSSLCLIFLSIYIVIFGHKIIRYRIWFKI